MIYPLNWGFLVTGLGLEPKMTESKSVVLPITPTSINN